MDIYRSSTHNCQNLGLMNEYIHTTEYYPVLKRNLDCRRSNQSILKEISPEYSLEGLMLKLKLQYSGHLMRRTDSSEKTLMLQRLKAGGEGDDRGWDGWMASPTQRTKVGVIGDGQGGLACCSPWDHKELEMTEQQKWSAKEISYKKTWELLWWFSDSMVPMQRARFNPTCQQLRVCAATKEFAHGNEDQRFHVLQLRPGTNNFFFPTKRQSGENVNYKKKEKRRRRRERT